MPWHATLTCAATANTTHSVVRTECNRLAFSVSRAVALDSTSSLTYGAGSTMDGSVDFAEFYATILRVRLLRSASHRTA